MTDKYDKIVETIGLVLGLMNLQENLTQNDKQEIMDSLDTKTHELLDQINQHLQRQDEKLDKIYNLLYNKNDNKNKEGY